MIERMLLDKGYKRETKHEQKQSITISVVFIYVAVGLVTVPGTQWTMSNNEIMNERTGKCSPCL